MRITLPYWVLLLACAQIIDISCAFAPPFPSVGGSRGSHHYQQQQQFVKKSSTIISNDANIRSNCGGALLQQLAVGSKRSRRAFVHNMILHGHSSSTLEKSSSNHTAASGGLPRQQLNNSNYQTSADYNNLLEEEEANNYNIDAAGDNNNNIGRNNISSSSSESSTNGEEEEAHDDDDMTAPYAVREYTHEHDVCILDDSDQNDDDNDEMIEELFTSLLRKVGQYNPEAVVTSSSSSVVKSSSSSSHQNQTIISQQQQQQQQQPVSILRQAFNLAKSAHANQCRKSGELYITHPLGVAHILADKGIVDMTSLLTALLHDTVEDTDVTLHQIVELFGDEVGECVDGVTKIGKVKFMSYEEQQSENYRKLILAMAKDIRVILVKLADRLHNMRTLQYMPKEKQQRIARETMEIYAPLAHRLGIYKVKTELEDLCFRYLRPKKFMALESQINDAQVELTQYEEEVVIMLERLMKDSGVGVAPNSSLLVKGRTKGLWSIYNKMKRQGIELEGIHDVIGFRIIVDDVSSCYQALGVVHANFRPVPNRIKDLIALPKPNGYQSLHTTVIGPRGKRVEIQIRTKEMDEVAESGIAAHWIYKQGGGGGGGGGKNSMNQFAWLRQLVDDVRRQSDPKEFVKSVKEDLFAKEVFVFSPTGDIYPLARGSSVLDFAYKVHSELGAQCTGAKVNGRIASMRYHLQNGDVVQIMTSKTQTPKREWLQYVRTSKAKSRIRAWLLKRNQKRSSAIRGKELIEEGLKKFSKSEDDGKKEYQRKLEHLLTTFKLQTENHLFTALSHGQLSVKNVMREIFGSAAIATANDRSESSTGEERDSQVLNKSPSVLSDAPSNANGIVVGRERNILLRFCRNCSPLYGDSIKGVITKGKGIKVHRTGCKYLTESDDKRVVEVAWDKNVKDIKLRPVELQVVCTDSPGVLADMSRTITSLGMNIGNVTLKKIKNGRGLARFEVMLGNLDDLEKVMTQLRQEVGVLSVSRR